MPQPTAEEIDKEFSKQGWTKKTYFFSKDEMNDFHIARNFVEIMTLGASKQTEVIIDRCLKRVGIDLEKDPSLRWLPQVDKGEIVVYKPPVKTEKK